ncbi:MAG TPA: SusC/RagA family protein [Alistipes sp.]|nr:SusC/RagA family protein [Alistipes sp.]
MNLKSTIYAACRGLMLVAALCFVAPVSAQSGARGVVKDAEGGGIIGASVVQKNTTNGVSTGADGAFTLPGVKNGDVLQVSFIGYVAQEVVWKGTPLEIVMVEDAQIMDEVVVVGYGVQKKTNVTGAVSMVDSKAFASRPVQNVSQALQGQIPGLTMSIGNSGGTLDSEMSISIRGAGTIGSGSSGSPLVLIDGIEGNMNTVNPNDIESVSVLKDAASASIYGARAAFGVILITTKGGKSDKVRVNYTGNVRFSDAIQIPEMVDSYTFASYWNVANSNDGNGAIFNEEALNRIKTYMSGGYTDPTKDEYYGVKANMGSNKYDAYGNAFANTDWFDTFYKNWVPSQEHNLSLSGGTDKVTYYVSGNFLGQNGLIAFGEDNFDRYTMTGKISAKLAKWATMNYTTKWTREDYSRPTYMTGLFFHNIARRWPTNPVYDPNGHLFPEMETIQLQDGGKERNQKDYYTNQMQFVFEPVKDWHITLDGSLRHMTRANHWEVLPIYGYYVDNTPYLLSWNGGAAGYSEVSEQRWSEDYFSTNIMTDYAKEINGHYFKVLVGFNGELYKNDYLRGFGEDLITPDVPELSITQKNFKASNSKSELALAGFFGRINYNYKERYMAEINVRYDGSSRFVGDKQWGTFPSFSLGWNIAREEFMADYTDLVGMLKLRGSWGQLGNNTINSYYPFYQTQSTGALSSGWLIGGEKLNTAGLPGIVSDVLTWETVESWDVGFDFAMFKNRFTGAFSYYQRSTYDMVGPAPTLPSILGTSAPAVNNCDMRSYGWELELAWRDKIGKDFTYGARFTLSDNQQKILRYPNKTGSLSQYYAGAMRGEIWGYTTAGIAQTQEEMDNHLQNNRPNWGSGWGAGDIMYKNLVDRYDENGEVIDEGVVNNGSNTLMDHGDLRVIGNSTPRYNFGLMLDAQWKGLDFSIFFQGVMKRDYWLSGPYFWGADGGMWQSCAFKEHLDYWSPDNRDAYYPKAYFNNGGKNKQTQTRYLQDASYIRLKNFQIGYTLPKKWTSKAGMESVRIYLSCDNMWTGTSLSSIFDPELLGGDWGPGKLYPTQRTISLGANINF